MRDCDARCLRPKPISSTNGSTSDYPFHAVRDHVLHNELMIGCLWAGRTDCGIDIVELMKRYFIHGPTAKYGHDQRMLGLMLWPLIRSRCLVHDKYYRLAGVHTVPLRDPRQPLRRRPSDLASRAAAKSTVSAFRACCDAGLRATRLI